MKSEPRIAFFTDSYLEVNGVAHTSRQLAAFASSHDFPLLCVHAGPETGIVEEGSLTRLSLKRTSFGFRLDEDLRYDLLMWRHASLAVETARSFRAEAVHITGPSDIGQLGVYVARKLRLPLVISWHTNIHEYAGTRLRKILPFVPSAAREAICGFAAGQSLKVVNLFYRLGNTLMAPNEELRRMLADSCGRATFLMKRGVDTDLFSPGRRLQTDRRFTLGYVGRLTPEKNVRLLAWLEAELSRAAPVDFRFEIVGAGSEREWLESRMSRATFTGVLKGRELAHAYANLDLMVFPSRTDTFGNVVLEAQASGVPVVVSDRGGPKFIIEDGATGLIAKDDSGFLEAVLRLMRDPDKLQAMREAARSHAESASWEAIFREVYRVYGHCLESAGFRRRPPLGVGAAMAGRNVSG